MILTVLQIPDNESKLAHQLLDRMNMSRYISKGVLLLALGLVIFCGLYTLSLWVIGRDIFTSQANSSMLTGPDSKDVGSRQIAQRFTKDVQPRPSATTYDASTSISSAVAPSNNFFHQNRDSGVAETPLLERPTQKVCLFYDC
jgi:K+-transporting ATPase c subunit